MALLNKADLGQTQADLARWLAGRVPDATDIEVSGLSSPGASGFSNQTVFFRAAWTTAEGRQEHELVARLAPLGPRLFPTYDLVEQFTLMKTLAEDTDVPMPAMWWVEPGSETFGEPFYVMERVHGNVPTDDPPYMAQGWVMDLTADQRRTMFESGLQALAAIHAVDWKARGLGFLDRPERGSTPMAQSLSYFEDYYDWARFGDREHPVLDAAFAWVRENLPDSEPEVVLSWGDSRPGNLMVADDMTVAAVLDWELATLGSRELDVAWWIFTQTMFSEGYGLPLPDGIPTTAETVEIYERSTGHRLANLEFHIRYAGLRSSLMFLRYCGAMVEVGAIPAGSDLVHNNPILQSLAKVMGLDSTQGDVNALKMNRAQS